MTAKIKNPWGDGRDAAVSDPECCARPCLNIGEDKGVFVKGRGYTRYYDNPQLECMTRHLHGCPYPKPEPRPEQVRCCRVPDFPKPRKGHNPHKQKCRNCGEWAEGVVLELRRQIPALDHIDCDHRDVYERDERDFLGYKVWACPDCNLRWKGAKPKPKDPGVTFDQLLMERFPRLRQEP